MAEIVLRPMKLEDQEMVMKWRTLPQITRYMNTNSITDIEKQKEWFKGRNSLTPVISGLLSGMENQLE